MPRPQWSDKWTLRKLITNTFSHNETRSRFENKDRDVLKGIRIESRTVHEGTSDNRQYQVFRIISSSYPQYRPYIERRHLVSGSKQRKYKHQYNVTISLPRLSIDAPVKLRTGSDRGWDFSPSARARVEKHGGVRRVIESKNVDRGRNGDFFFRLEALYARENILFGRNWTNGPALQVNSHNIVFLDKHMLRVVELLLARSILKTG